MRENTEGDSEVKRIESAKNPKVKEIKKLHKRKEREKSGLFLIEGDHALTEAVRSQAWIEEIFIKEHKEWPQVFNEIPTPATEVTESVMKEISSTETPKNIVAVCRIPEFSNVRSGGYSFFVLVDSIQDPGNLGTIIRTVDALGKGVVVLGTGTVDAYNEKVVRATQGSLFHVPVLQEDLGEWLEWLQETDIPCFGTSLDEGTSYSALEPQPYFALIIGNEGAGVQKKWLERTDQNLYIPIPGQAESLNAAVSAGILLYHLKQTDW
ncbi:TrmH family RNA methyltransferase [Marinococcus luteus]|uniref:TrmH family RNA methyltransferase n=1 Tax=Marinococcus luteus TaxID=1122204 RepID=UPI002ACC3A99|nr:RNA methyltransferase [Marinococcus luteus]MDZ5783764.1 RNA methyltransferase [Marinococcus luteus]